MNGQTSLFRICMIVLLFGSAVCAQGGVQAGSEDHAWPREIKMGISMSIPPWVIKKDNSGIELDILVAAFNPRQYVIKPSYVPFARAYSHFESGLLDGVINANKTISKSGYLSDTVVTFQNVAISLAQKHYPEKFPIDFLKDKSVIAFQNAKKVLSAEFGAMADRNPRYQEVPQQGQQISMLFIREIDFIVMDKSIFGYYWNQAVNDKSKAAYNYHKPVRFHPVFKPSPYPFIFKEKHIRDEFNHGLKRIKESGEFDRILKKYDHLSDLYRRNNRGNDE